MSDNREYPIVYFKDLHLPKWVADKTEEIKLQRDGWTSDRKAIPPQEYPKTIYRPNGEAMVIGDYNDDGIVDLEKARAQEAAFLAKGFTLKPTVAPEGDSIWNVGGIRLGRIDELESRLEKMEGILGEMQQWLRSQAEGRAELRKNTGRRDSRPAAVAVED